MWTWKLPSDMTKLKAVKAVKAVKVVKAVKAMKAAKAVKAAKAKKLAKNGFNYGFDSSCREDVPDRLPRPGTRPRR